MYQIILTYKNLIFQITLSISLSLLLYFINLPSLLLHGLNTYIHPDDVNPSKPQSGPKLAICRPSDQQQPHHLNGVHNRKKTKDRKVEFDESKAQIFRLKLSDAHVQSRLFFDSYSGLFNCFFVCFCCFLLHKYLVVVDDGSGGSSVPSGCGAPVDEGIAFFQDTIDECGGPMGEGITFLQDTNHGCGGPMGEGIAFLQDTNHGCGGPVDEGIAFLQDTKDGCGARVGEGIAFLKDNDGSGVLKNGSLVVIIIGVLGIYRGLVSLLRVSIESSAFRRSERQCGMVFGVLGFIVGVVICSEVYDWVFDFDFSKVDGFGRLFVALLAGLITGFLYLAAGKNARAFWLGTDQIRCNLSIVQCGWFARIVLYGSYLIVAFTSLLWIKPLAVIFVNTNIGGSKGVGSSSSGGHRERLVGNIGMLEDEFIKLRVWCLFLSGVLQLVVLRVNVQTYLDEAVLSWYQRLHASVVPDLDYSRAKVFLHNHYLCHAVLQFLAPPALVLIFLGLSQVDSFDNFQLGNGMQPFSAFTKQVFLFLSWWVTFVWFVFTSAYLGFYRRGILYIS